MYDSALPERPVGSTGSVAPQHRQKFFPGVTGVPQLGQTASSGAPQSSQKRASAGFSTWHRGHVMPEPPSTQAGEGPHGFPRLAPGALVVNSATITGSVSGADTPRCLFSL